MHLPKTEEYPILKSSGGLVTLYEILRWLLMEQFKAHTFYNVGKLVESIASAHGSSWLLGSGFTNQIVVYPGVDEPLSNDEASKLGIVLEAMRNECVAIKLERATQYINDILGKLNNSQRLTHRECGFSLRELDKHIR